MNDLLIFEILIGQAEFGELNSLTHNIVILLHSSSENIVERLLWLKEKKTLNLSSEFSMGLI